jgi:prepilin-type N-terminal cleavage/methylation domain-containing protein
MRAVQKKNKTKSGFTLTEVMVVLVISSLMASGILKSHLFITKTLHRQIEFNNNLTQTRYFTQLFKKRVNAAQKSELSIEDGGNQLNFTHYNEGNDVWENAMLQYQPTSSNVVYACSGRQKLLLTGVTPLNEGTTGIFLITNRMIRCQLRIGEDEKLSIPLNITARPRNP